MTLLTHRRRLVWLALGTLLVLLSAGAWLLLGTPDVSLETALSDTDSVDHRTLAALYLPRLALALVVGAILGLSGAVLQGLLRNPLADPFILGVSGGAALGSTAVALLGGTASALAMPLGGFAGALGALVLVTALAADRRGRVSPLKVLLIGVIVNALAGAALMVLQTFAAPEAVQTTLMRLMGSLGVDPGHIETLVVVTVTLVGAAALSLVSARNLNLLALGDETARSLGVRPDRLRVLLFVGLSVPIGAAVAVSGLIGFVGLIVPHAVRLVCGPDHRLLLPLSALVGAAFVALADAVVAALSVPLMTELPVGVVTALVGGPVFLVLLRARPAGVSE